MGTVTSPRPFQSAPQQPRDQRRVRYELPARLRQDGCLSDCIDDSEAGTNRSLSICLIGRSCLSVRDAGDGVRRPRQAFAFFKGACTRGMGPFCSGNKIAALRVSSALTISLPASRSPALGKRIDTTLGRRSSAEPTRHRDNRGVHDHRNWCSRSAGIRVHNQREQMFTDRPDLAFTIHRNAHTKRRTGRASFRQWTSPPTICRTRSLGTSTSAPEVIRMWRQRRQRSFGRPSSNGGLRPSAGWAPPHVVHVPLPPSELPT